MKWLYKGWIVLLFVEKELNCGEVNPRGKMEGLGNVYENDVND